jgi:transposase
MNSQSSSSASRPDVFIGIDWAEKQHMVAVLEANADAEQLDTLDQRPEAIAAWAADLLQRYPGCRIAVAVEQSRGPLAHALRQYEHLQLFPINPKQLANYRKAMTVGKKKDDRTDACLLARFLREHHHQLRAWRPDEPLTRQLGALCELRRTMVDDRKKRVQQLRNTLLSYFPLILELVRELHHPVCLELLRRWPSLAELKRAKPDTLRKLFRDFRRGQTEDVVQQIRATMPLTTDPAVVEPSVLYVKCLVKQIEQLNEAIEQFDKEIGKLFAQHPDAELFRSLPGAGDALAPRLLTAMGDDRDRYESAANVQAYSGIAPVTIQSGKSQRVERRYLCSKFLLQTFHEFAEHARRWSPWSKAFYQSQRAKGKKPNAAVRALAFKWIRILFRMWKDRVPYNEAHYVKQLKKANSPLVKLLESA